MRVYDLMKSIKATLLENAELAEYCRTRFGRGVKVYIGVDEQNLPLPSECPLIALDINKIEYSSKNQIVDANVEIRISAVIQYDSVTKDNGVEYDGIGVLEELLEIIKKTKLCDAFYVWVSGAPIVTEDGTRRHPIYAHSEIVSFKLSYVRR